MNLRYIGVVGGSSIRVTRKCIEENNRRYQDYGVDLSAVRTERDLEQAILTFHQNYTLKRLERHR